MGPVLDALRDLGGSARPAEVRDRVAERLGVEDIETLGFVPSGQSKFVNRVNWARFYLAKAGFIDASRRGVWALSESGRAQSFEDPEAARQLARTLSEQMRAAPEEPGDVSSAVGRELTEDADAPEVGEYAGADPRLELMTIMRGLPPDGFERFCQRLLREAGFQDVTVTGKSGDGGIDGIGILQVNALVSFKVLFQCKRYQGSVSSPQVRDFRGAMMGRADKGIIITTGTFTADARREAFRDGVPPIELVDGDKLVDMLEELELGLKPVRAYEVDARFFDAFR